MYTIHFPVPIMAQTKSFEQLLAELYEVFPIQAKNFENVYQVCKDEFFNPETSEARKRQLCMSKFRLKQKLEMARTWWVDRYVSLTQEMLDVEVSVSFNNYFDEDDSPRLEYLVDMLEKCVQAAEEPMVFLKEQLSSMWKKIEEIHLIENGDWKPAARFCIACQYVFRVEQEQLMAQRMIINIVTVRDFVETHAISTIFESL